MTYLTFLRSLCLSVALMGFLFLSVPSVFAQSSQEVRATVQDILIDEEQQNARRFVFLAEDSAGELYTVDSNASYVEGVRYTVREGQEVLLQIVEHQDGQRDVFLVDVVRTRGLIWIAVLFAVGIFAVAGRRGFNALLGLGVTVSILFGILLPKILEGGNPVTWTVLCGAVILAVNMPLTHGLSRSTARAWAATVCGLALAWLFSDLFISLANLSGVASEEEALLLLQSSIKIQPIGLLLAGMILGAVGVLDDIAITQTETVEALREANPSLSSGELFRRAMKVGRHHIASVVNTLVLAYAAVALPLFLLFLSRPDIASWRFINEELIATEVVRTLAGTLALVLVVPLATWFATLSAHTSSRHEAH